MSMNRDNTTAKKGKTMKKEKNKLTKCIMILSAVLLLSLSVSGCGQDKNVPVSEFSDSITISEVEAEIPEETEVTSVAETETEQTEESGEEFDFVSTLESTYICGHQLSYPLTWRQFEDDFEIDMESWDSQFGKSLFNVMYNGNRVGMFMISDCENTDMLNSESKIVMIRISSYDDNGDIQLFSVNGITFNNKRSEIREILDDKHDNSVIKTIDNYHEKGIGAFRLFYDLTDEETLQTLSISSFVK